MPSSPLHTLHKQHTFIVDVKEWGYSIKKRTFIFFKRGCRTVIGLFVLLTVSWAAAGVRAAAAADVAAAGVRTALAPADPQQQQEQDAAQDYRSHKRPF